VVRGGLFYGGEVPQELGLVEVFLQELVVRDRPCVRRIWRLEIHVSGLLVIMIIWMKDHLPLIFKFENILCPPRISSLSEI
jgi:hypothetical protein